MTDRKTTKRRLEGAGYAYHSGWLPTTNPVGSRFDAQVDMHRADVERIAAEPKRRGRPKSLDKTTEFTT